MGYKVSVFLNFFLNVGYKVLLKTQKDECRY